MNDTQKIIIAAGVIAVIVVAAAYTHHTREQVRVAGLMFGNSLLNTQDDLKAAQDALALRTRAWSAGNMTDAAMLEYYDMHLDRMDGIVARYSSLDAPQGFDAAVRLFELSAVSQRDSDVAHAEWVRLRDESSRSRSDALLQDAFEYESEALSAFADAQRGRPAG